MMRGGDRDSVPDTLSPPLAVALPLSAQGLRVSAASLNRLPITGCTTASQGLSEAFLSF